MQFNDYSLFITSDVKGMVSSYPFMCAYVTMFYSRVYTVFYYSIILFFISISVFYVSYTYFASLNIFLYF